MSLIFMYLSGALLSFAQPVEKVAFTSSGVEARTFSVRFLDEMNQHYVVALELAQFAMQKGHHIELRELGRRLVEDHAKEIATLQRFKSGLFPSEKSFSPQISNLVIPGLMGPAGNDRDVAILDAMIMHYPGGIYLGMEIQRQSRNRDILDLASRIEQRQQKDLSSLRGWRDAWTRR